MYFAFKLFLRIVRYSFHHQQVTSTSPHACFASRNLPDLKVACYYWYRSRFTLSFILCLLCLLVLLLNKDSYLILKAKYLLVVNFNVSINIIKYLWFLFAVKKGMFFIFIILKAFRSYARFCRTNFFYNKAKFKYPRIYKYYRR